MEQKETGLPQKETDLEKEMVQTEMEQKEMGQKEMAGKWLTKPVRKW